MDKNAFYYSEFTNKNGILAFLNGVLLYFVTTSFVEKTDAWLMRMDEAIYYDGKMTLFC